MYRILYNGSDREIYLRLLNGLPASMELISCPSRCKEDLSRQHAHAIVLPLSQPQSQDLCYLQSLIGTSRIPEIVVVAQKLTVNQAVCIMRFGAYDCLCGPVCGEILGLVFKRMFSDTKTNAATNSVFLGQSSSIVQLRKQLMEYATYDYPLLITGETGSGKELAAKTVHSHSCRKDGPFVPVNSAAFTDELLITELFGACRGAFTGAVDRTGLFEYATNGTIFLDEIGEMSLVNQAKILRVIDDLQIRRLGSNRTKRVNVRIIAASNRDLNAATKHGGFRTDLLYRLGTLRIKVPPLRQRTEDIPPLARHFLATVSNKAWRMDYSALNKLMSYHWPGNIRELHSVLLSSTIRAKNCVLCSDDIRFN